MSKILNEKSLTLNSLQFDDNEENCKQWFLSTYPCLCKTNVRLKPKQLFLGKYKIEY